MVYGEGDDVNIVYGKRGEMVDDDDARRTVYGVLCIVYGVWHMVRVVRWLMMIIMMMIYRDL